VSEQLQSGIGFNDLLRRFDWSRDAHFYTSAWILCSCQINL